MGSYAWVRTAVWELPSLGVSDRRDAIVSLQRVQSQ